MVALCTCGYSELKLDLYIEVTRQCLSWEVFLKVCEYSGESWFTKASPIYAVVYITRLCSAELGSNDWCPSQSKMETWRQSGKADDGDMKEHECCQAWSLTSLLQGRVGDKNGWHPVDASVTQWAITDFLSANDLVFSQKPSLVRHPLSKGEETEAWMSFGG